MAKSTREKRRIASRTPYRLPSKIHSGDEIIRKKSTKIGHKKDWEDSTCSVCMEYPHNAVLLLCSSHDKGCRPYMCGTSLRHSNCLDQYRKAYTKITSSPCIDVDMGRFSSWLAADKCEVTELPCPLCRGQVKGWTVVDSARQYLNRKPRTCVHDNCTFVGNYKELRKHVKTEHPCAKPRDIDPLLKQKWRSLEGEREREDVISTITSSMPNALVIGDYVIEGGRYGNVSEEEEEEDEEVGFDEDMVPEGNSFDIGINSNLMNVLLFLQSIGSGRHDRGTNNLITAEDSTVGLNYSDQDSENYGENDDDNDNPSVVNSVRRQSQLFLGHSGRRQRRGGDDNRGNS